MILEDKTPPPCERLGTPTMSMPPGSHQILAVCSLGCTCQCLARNRGVGLYMPALGSRHQCGLYRLVLSSKYWCWVVYAGIAYTSWQSFLGCFMFVVAVNDGDNPCFMLSLCSCFDILCMPTSIDNDKGRGEVQGGVGCPHFQRLSWLTFWLI